MKRCDIPPAGWFCSRDAGHTGPCAARPLEASYSGWASPTLGRVYHDVEILRDKIAQHPESGIDESLRRLLEAIEAADVELEAIAL